jgi:hypothetical protein
MFYVCAIATDQWMQFLAGPYENEDEAMAASGAYEVEHPEHRMKTFVWTCRAGREYLIRQFDHAAASSRGESAAQLPDQPRAPRHPDSSLLA